MPHSFMSAARHPGRTRCFQLKYSGARVFRGVREFPGTRLPTMGTRFLGYLLSVWLRAWICTESIYGVRIACPTHPWEGEMAWSSSRSKLSPPSQEGGAVMMIRARISTVGLMCVVALAGTSTRATALSFTFSQSGYSQGATVTGTFSGTDLNLDGQLVSFHGEITGFSMSFSGNATVAAFSLGLADLFGVVYDLGSGFLGDGAIEGIAATDPNFNYQTGQGPTSSNGGFVQDLNTLAIDNTSQLVTIVPEPTTLVLVGLGMVGLATASRRRKV